MVNYSLIQWNSKTAIFLFDLYGWKAINPTIECDHALIEIEIHIELKTLNSDIQNSILVLHEFVSELEEFEDISLVLDWMQVFHLNQE